MYPVLSPCCYYHHLVVIWHVEVAILDGEMCQGVLWWWWLLLWLQMIRESSTVKVKESFIQRLWEPLKNASYPTSIVFKGLIKSRVEEESSIKDQLLNTTVYPVLIYYVTRLCMSKQTVQDCAWVSILCMRLCRAVRRTSKERKSIEGNKSVNKK